MLISCPNCHRRFNLRPEALGLAGREVRCGNCHHKWHQEPDLDGIEEEMLGDEMPAAAAMLDEERAPSFGNLGDDLDEVEAESGVDAPPMGGGGLDSMMVDMETDTSAIMAAAGEALSAEELAEDDKIADELEKEAPEPIPSVFATAPAKVPEEFEEDREERGTAFWITVIVVILVILVGGLYIFRDSVVGTWPQLGRLYELAGIRSLAPGAGLDLKNATAERSGTGASEVLTVKGSVVNTTGTIKTIPTLHLTLYASKTMLQDVYADPPRPLLDANATTDFSIALPQPDQHATRFEVTFAAGKPQAAPPAPPTTASTPTAPPAGPAMAPSAGSAPPAAAPNAGAAPAMTPPAAATAPNAGTAPK